MSGVTGYVAGGAKPQVKGKKGFPEGGPFRLSLGGERALAGEAAEWVPGGVQSCRDQRRPAQGRIRSKPPKDTASWGAERAVREGP